MDVTHSDHAPNGGIPGMRLSAVLLCSVACTIIGGEAVAADAPKSSAAGVTTVDEVVVTAEKRPEKLSQMTVTASVLSAETIQRNQISDISDINKLAPAVNLAGTFNGRVPLAVRGIESQSNEAAVGIASGVAVEIDGVAVPSDSFAANDVEDVLNIEILEGPQATLGGRTATSGLINYITHKPTPYWTGTAAVSLTNDEERHVQGAISGPIVSSVEMSLTGWDHYTKFPILNLQTGRHSDDLSYGGRGKLLFHLNDNLDASVMGRLSRTESTGFNFVYSYIDPGTTLLIGSGGPPFLSPQALISPGITVSNANTRYASPVTTAGERRDDADGSLNLEYRMAGYTVSSTTAYQHESRKSVQDLFAVNTYFWNVLTGGHAPPFDNTQTQWVSVGQWTEELKLSSPATDKFNYVAGLFFTDTTVKLHEYRNFIPALNDSFVNPDTNSYAAYVHANWTFAPDTTLVGGVRFNYDAISYDINQLLYAGTSPNLHSSGSSHATALVGDIGIKHQLTPRSMVYVTYTRGYAPEVYNTALSLQSNSDVLKPVSQESIDNFELGSKGRYFGDRLQLNGTLFLSRYHHFQIQTFINIPGAAIGILDLSSVGEAEAKGAELDVSLKPWTGGTVGFNFAYVDAKFIKYVGGPCWWAGHDPATFPSTCSLDAAGNWRSDLSGKTMPNAPKTKFHLSFDQQAPIGAYSLDVGADLSYRARTQMQADQNPQAFEPSHTLLNLHATLSTTNARYAVTAFVNNLTNQHYSVDVEDFWNAPWASNAIVVQPARDTKRYFGVRMNAKF